MLSCCTPNIFKMLSSRLRVVTVLAVEDQRMIKETPTAFERAKFDTLASRPGEWSCLPKYADMAELADALDSGSSSRKGVEVQVLLSAPHDRGELYEREKCYTLVATKTGLPELLWTKDHG